MRNSLNCQLSFHFIFLIQFLQCTLDDCMYLQVEKTHYVCVGILSQRYSHNTAVNITKKNDDLPSKKCWICPSNAWYIPFR